jgi:CubicO group peptidase (beta-lactamase class C family)
VKPTKQRSAAAFAFAFIATVLALPAYSGEFPRISPGEIDDTVARAMKVFDVPGMAVGIVEDGKLVYAKGYGVREYGKPGPVDADTLFQIGSNTKAFTAAALAILVDEGRIHWDDKVTDYLPQFQLYDPYVTREFTIRDLLSHRSGLGPGAGDLMYYPTTDFTRAEIIHGLRYLKPVSSFRSKYDYDNLLYMVAGEIIPAVTGQAWEDFIKERILDPLQMRPCAANYDRIVDHSNVASPHVVIEGKVTPIPVENLNVIGPAGTINCSINGMARWLETQLAGGKTPNGLQLFSGEGGNEMWSANTLEPINPSLAALTRTHFKAYGLGWELEDEFGYKRVSHTGGVPGTVTWVAMIPELQFGILVLTNQENGSAMEAVGNQILDAYVGAPKRDLVNMLKSRADERSAEFQAIKDKVWKIAAAGPPPLPLNAYAGRYTDPWRGDATVRREGDNLVLKFSRTKELEGNLIPLNGNVFIVRWDHRGLKADAYVRFTQDFGETVAGMSMQAVSPDTDFSFDFDDLNFKKVEATAAAREEH